MKASGRGKRGRGRMNGEASRRGAEAQRNTKKKDVWSTCYLTATRCRVDAVGLDEYREGDG